MSKFSEIWSNEVKPLAEACITDTKLVQIYKKYSHYCIPLTSEERNYMQRSEKKHKDPYGMIGIADMVEKVDKALYNGCENDAKFFVDSIYKELTDKSYFIKTFKANPFSKEWKSRKALANGIANLLANA